MPEYSILILPSANRVYTDTSRRLLRAELAVFGQTVLSTETQDAQSQVIGGVDYVTFSTSAPLDEADIHYLSNLSSAYALFEHSGELLRPLSMTPVRTFDTDLLTIQKYAGKTNELFTQLLLNLTVLNTDRPQALVQQGLNVVDPLCGRGTTLNQAMMYGFDAVGLEMNSKDFEAYQQFIKTWLRNKRIKHTADTSALRQHKVRLGRRLDIEYGASKEQYKAGRTRHLTYLNCDTLHTADLLRRNSADVIVTDAPYGVQHGSQQSETRRSRHPRDLLAAALPSWNRVLRTGGALGISWNTYAINRETLVEIVTDAGFTVQTDAPFTELAHRVDHAIVRDVLIARK